MKLEEQQRKTWDPDGQKLCHCGAVCDDDESHNNDGLRV